MESRKVAIKLDQMVHGDREAISLELIRWQTTGARDEVYSYLHFYYCVKYL